MQSIVSSNKYPCSDRHCLRYFITSQPNTRRREYRVVIRGEVDISLFVFLGSSPDQLFKTSVLQYQLFWHLRFRFRQCHRRNGERRRRRRKNMSEVTLPLAFTELSLKRRQCYFWFSRCLLTTFLFCFFTQSCHKSWLK